MGRIGALLRDTCWDCGTVWPAPGAGDRCGVIINYEICHRMR
jgi:hypothetical protein